MLHQIITSLLTNQISVLYVFLGLCTDNSSLVYVSLGNSPLAILILIFHVHEAGSDTIRGC